MFDGLLRFLTGVDDECVDDEGRSGERGDASFALAG
jgi:hypothetical protein